MTHTRAAQLFAAVMIGFAAFLVAASSVTQGADTSIYTGNTRVDCPVCLNRPQSDGLSTPPNTPERRASCVKYKRCTRQQVGLAGVQR